jgi:nucleoside-diphosphate-sugar epimerase
MEHPAAKNNDFNISIAESTTVLQLAEAVWKKVHGDRKPFRYVSDPAFKYDVQMRVPAVEKAKRVLGYEAVTPLSAVLDEVVPWIDQQVQLGTI